MKRFILAVILAVVLTLTLATPAFAGPPEDKPGQGKGTIGNDGLWNAREHLLSTAEWFVNPAFPNGFCVPFGAAVVDWLYHEGHPLWFVQ